MSVSNGCATQSAGSWAASSTSPTTQAIAKSAMGIFLPKPDSIRVEVQAVDEKDDPLKDDSVSDANADMVAE